jgi:hypothetical protein
LGDFVHRVSVLLTFLALTPCFAVGGTTSYLCEFPLEASPKGLSKQASPFELRFVVDSNTQKAYLIGNVGSSEIEIIPNTYGVSFVEVTGSGNVMVTAITTAGDAVHSRNGIISKKLLPSQLYGKCSRQ